MGLPVAGDVIAGKYAIVKVLGEGGMGIVYEAMHQKLRQRVAIKMLLPTMLDAVIVERFEREARAAAKLTSRHVARVIDVDATPAGLPYMVMEFLQGHDLDQEIQRRGKLPAEEAVDYVLQTCAAMNEAHGLGIVHRDLKPSNLFLAWDGPDARIVKVLDFGISKVAGDGDGKLTGAETVMGTAMYMSPEQVKSAGNVDQRTDIWALGVVLYELLSGRPPFQGTTTQLAAQIVTERAPDVRVHAVVSAELAQVVNRALEMHPRDRFQNVRDFVVALTPHAPHGSVGRIFGDAVTLSSGSFPRVSLPVAGGPPPSDRAATVIQSDAVSQSTRRDGGTAPGWTQPPSTHGRKRRALVGMLVAFLGGTVVLGSGTIFFLRMRSTPVAPPAITAAARSDAPPANEPPPPSIEPAPPPTGAPGAENAKTVAPQPAVTTTKPQPHVPGAQHVPTPPAVTTSSPPATHAPPPPAPTPAASNPF
ncbi:MAG TPA: serine/threonine-protein kinase, partial [Labilithrix sp.]